MASDGLTRLFIVPVSLENLGLSGLASCFEHSIGYLGGCPGRWRGTSPSPESREVGFRRRAPNADLVPTNDSGKIVMIKTNLHPQKEDGAFLLQ